jgi:hypothetical protein
VKESVRGGGECVSFRASRGGLHATRTAYQKQRHEIRSRVVRIDVADLDYCREGPLIGVQAPFLHQLQHLPRPLRFTISGARLDESVEGHHCRQHCGLVHIVENPKCPAEQNGYSNF